jgi:outer membrane biosynthesis protein TonB
MSSAVIVAAALAGAVVARVVFGHPGAAATLLIAVVVGVGAAAVEVAVARRTPDRAPADEREWTPPIKPPPKDQVEPDPDPWWGDKPSPRPDAPPRTQLDPEPPPAPPAAPVDLAPYRRHAPPRRIPQCPACGGVALHPSPDAAGRIGFACRDCATEWAWAAGDPWPPVVVDVRHRRGVADDPRPPAR